MSHYDLPSDLWFYIASKLDSAGDRIRFRAVSKSWRSLLPFRQPPWLMLAQDESDNPNTQQEQHNDNAEQEQEPDPVWLTVLDSSHEFFFPPPPHGFVCLSDQKIRHVDFPELDRVRVVGSTGNWLITMHLDKTLRMLNPFSRQQIHLPPPRTFETRNDYLDAPGVSPEEYRDELVTKVVLSSPPSSDGGGDWVAIAIHHYAKGSLAIARPGDTLWTTVGKTACAEDVIFYKQRFYAVSNMGRLMVCNIGGGGGGVDFPNTTHLTDPILFLQKIMPYRVQYLVECSGELLYVRKYIDKFRDPVSHKTISYKTYGFEVYRFDFTAMKFVELRSLGEFSLFLGHNGSVSVPASDYYGLVRKNCIYFTDDLLGYVGSSIPGGHDMGVYDMGDGTITPHYKGTSTSLYSPPVWVVPTA